MINYRLFSRYHVVLVAFLLSIAIGGIARAESISIGGTGSALGTMKMLSEAFKRQHPTIEIEILPSLGSGGGIKALIGNAIDIAVSARLPKDSELKEGIEASSYGRSPLAFVGSGHNLPANLSSSEILEIYNGQRIHWPSRHPIRLVLRPESETDAKLIANAIPGLGEAIALARKQPGVPIAYNDQENVQELAALHGSLGTATLSQIRSENLDLQPLSLDGVAPTTENLQNGTYAIWKRYWLVTRNNSAPAVNSFMEFVLSEQGRRVLEKTGHDITKNE